MKNHQKDYENEQYGAEIKRRMSPLDENINPPPALAPAAIRQQLDTAPSRNPKKRTQWGALALATAVLLLCMLPGTVWRDIRGFGQQSNTDASGNQAVTVAANYDDVISVARTIQQNASRYSYRDELMMDGATNYSGDMEKGSVAEDSARATSPALTGGGSDYTDTNVQVEGVDEADIVKTDGSYIYAVNRDQGAVLIVSVSPDGTMKIVSRVKLEAYSVLEFYVSGDRLIVITQAASPCRIYQEEASATQPYDGGVAYDEAPDYDYNYYDSYMNGGGGAKAIIYDIADRGNPKEMRAYSQDGSYLSSRLVDGRLYLITNHYIYATGPDGAYDLDHPEALVPNTSDSACGDEVSPVAARDIVIAGQPDAMSYVVVSALGTESADAPAVQKSVLGSGSAVYANSERLYVASISYAEDTPSTQVMCFDITSGLSYQTNGSVPGTILNQFSMDEWEGHLRIATTKQDFSSQTDGDVAFSQWSGGATTNNLYILDENLQITGRVEGLAPGESIYAVRFMGKTAYIVTFRQVDPLFAIDVSDPAAPKVLGQLKIPGFSSYLHPFSDHLLIGIGQQADPETGRTEGLKLSFFDVSDPADLKETHQYKFGNEYAYADALNDHKAVMVSREKGLLGFSVNSYEGDMSQIKSAFYLFRVDEASGFVLLGSVQNPDANGTSEGWETWQAPRRGLLIGGTLFTVSDNWIVATSLDGFAEIERLQLPM